MPNSPAQGKLSHPAAGDLGELVTELRGLVGMELAPGSAGISQVTQSPHSQQLCLLPVFQELSSQVANQRMLWPLPACSTATWKQWGVQRTALSWLGTDAISSPPGTQRRLRSKRRQEGGPCPQQDSALGCPCVHGKRPLGDKPSSIVPPPSPSIHHFQRAVLFP